MTVDAPAVLLVGGKGTRLRPVVSGVPKPLASIGDETFLHLLVRQLRTQGFRRLILCTGYLSEQIEAQFGTGAAMDVAIDYSVETSPLGTGGALKNALELVSDAADLLVLNGDSIVEVDYRKLLEQHRKSGAMATMVVRRVEDAARYGTVEIDSNQRVVAFLEKTGRSVAGLINAGVYAFRRDIFRHIPDGPASLEKDVFPRILDAGIQVREEHGLFIDIGTPEDYQRAVQLQNRLKQAASQGQGV